MIGGDLDAAYAIQDINIEHWSCQHRLVGHKLGFVSRFSQLQAGLSEPIYGALFSDMAFTQDEEIRLGNFCDIKVEAEVALVLGEDVRADWPIYSDIVRAIAFALPAVEIVDPCFKDWDFTPVDAVADNTGAAGFVLGGFPRRLDTIDWNSLSAQLSLNGQLVSRSGGEMFDSNPLAVAHWIARHVAKRGRSLNKDDVIMAGALGPPVAVIGGDVVNAKIAGLGSISFRRV